MHTAASESAFDFTIKRNCSISPRDLLFVLALAASLSLGIAAAFAFLGAWLIFPFAGLEVLALATAFYLNGRHATDYERIALSGDRLLVQTSEAGRIEEHEFDRRWLHVDEQRLGPDLRLRLYSRGGNLEIGRHLNTEGRASLAWSLRRSLSRSLSEY